MRHSSECPLDPDVVLLGEGAAAPRRRRGSSLLHEVDARSPARSPRARPGSRVFISMKVVVLRLRSRGGTRWSRRRDVLHRGLDQPRTAVLPIRLRTLGLGHHRGTGASSMIFWCRRWIEHSRSPRCTTVALGSPPITCTSMWRAPLHELLEVDRRPPPKAAWASLIALGGRGTRSARSPWRPDHPHASPASPRGGLQDHGEADVLARCFTAVSSLLHHPLGPRHHVGTLRPSSWPAACSPALVAHQAAWPGADGADELEVAGLGRSRRGSADSERKP